MNVYRPVDLYFLRSARGTVRVKIYFSINFKIILITLRELQREGIVPMRTNFRDARFILQFQYLKSVRIANRWRDFPLFLSIFTAPRTNVLLS